MERLDHIHYATPAGTPLQVRYERPLWVVVDNGTTCRFPSCAAWITYIRQEQGWPLPLHEASCGVDRGTRGGTHT